MLRHLHVRRFKRVCVVVQQQRRRHCFSTSTSNTVEPRQITASAGFRLPDYDKAATGTGEDACVRARVVCVCAAVISVLLHLPCMH